ncbi:MAG: hypothetical protein UR54_C0031G0004 [Candidatus Roizmanbacteria bacterium GW2011_GWA2_34_18]|uniref:Natural resistance-associated macrophage protein n=1 Tax=Candidatus Roizmanbacteria bacterium GW2011_GWA2_34_18 TaxID=1618477 RepID=A0A0G0D7H1_9BACT|nr:MAG: hypothetical protein UR54_C0031G0004 [Candidatus Roizmanbacteria bacterium GW2011_GWA2_34_18]
MGKLQKFFQKFKYRLIIFLAVLGPGIITAVADNDAGGVATYTVAASFFGMASQYMVIPITILLATTQEVGARIAIVTNRGLGSLIRERYGVKISLFVFIFYFIANQGVVLQNVSGLKSALQLFNLPWQLFLILICFALIFIVIKFNYKRLQRIFLFMILFYIAYIISAILTKPNWGEAIQESFIFPKKINVADFTYWFNFLSWMMAIAVTYTLFANHIKVADGYSAALSMTPIAGHLATVLFSVGLFSASILGLTIVPLATAYVFSEMFGFEGSLDADFKKGRLFYMFFIVQIVVALIITLFPQTSLFGLTLYADFLNAALLPIIFYFLISFSESTEIMGKYASHGLASWFLRLSAIVITIAVVVTFAGKIFHLG